MLPIHFPPRQTVYWWFRRFVRLLLFRTIHDIALMIDRERSGRNADPSAVVVDSQTIKSPAAAGTRGFDGAKKIVGRKRHIAVDIDGHLLMVNLTTTDSSGAQAILDGLAKRWTLIKHLFADGAYDRRQLLYNAAFLDFVVEIVRRTIQASIPRRGVVERTFGWLTRYRRLVRDYEARLDVSEAMIYAAMASPIIRRIKQAAPGMHVSVMYGTSKEGTALAMAADADIDNALPPAWASAPHALDGQPRPRRRRSQL
ncbi:transposase [Rhizobium mongolense]|uniref:Transposase n=1 Tax=Rhizobium mongolense TaxID=57676 RepID=A0A7W6RR69_9HYPH|nr:transposase [Rhizobium mongolense]